MVGAYTLYNPYPPMAVRTYAHHTLEHTIGTKSGISANHRNVWKLPGFREFTVQDGDRNRVRTRREFFFSGYSNKFFPHARDRTAIGGAGPAEF